jgi:hypothetical protein
MTDTEDDLIPRTGEEKPKLADQVRARFAKMELIEQVEFQGAWSRCMERVTFAAMQPKDGRRAHNYEVNIAVKLASRLFRVEMANGKSWRECEDAVTKAFGGGIT